MSLPRKRESSISYKYNKMDSGFPVCLTIEKIIHIACRRVPALCDIILKYKQLQQSAGTLLHIKDSFFYFLGQSVSPG